MISLHNWLNNLVESFTFYGGGKGGGQSQTTTSGIDPSMRPYVEKGLSEAQKLYETYTPQYYGGQTYVSPSAQTEAGLSQAEALARAGSPLINQAMAQQQGAIGGEYLGANPFLAAALRPGQEAATQAYNQAIGATRSGASQAGRYGSGAQTQLESLSQQNLANALANQAGQASYQNYAAERGIQEQAARGAPSMAQAAFQPINQLLQTGQARENYAQQALQSELDRFNFQQNLPYQRLAQFTSTVAGQPLTTQSTTQGSGGGKIVCTAMNEAYGFGSFRQAIWLKHSASMPNAKTIEKGYHRLCLPIVNFAFSAKPTWTRKLVRKIAEHIARHRTADLWKEMRGKRRDTLGRIYRAIIEPLCYLAGKAGK